MLKRMLVLVILVAFGVVNKSTAQDIMPMPIPTRSPTTIGPLTTLLTTDVSENVSTTPQVIEEDTSPTVTTQTEVTPDVESTTGITTTDAAVSETTKEAVTETATDPSQSTTEDATSTPEQTTTENGKTSTEDDSTIAPTTASTPTEPTSTLITSTEEDSTVVPTTTTTTTPTPTESTTRTSISTTTSRPFDTDNRVGSPLICRAIQEDGRPYYNWILRVIIVPKLCYFCCRLGYYGLEHCTAINPFFCSC